MSRFSFLAIRIPLYVVWSCALTWPMVRWISTHYPLGLENTSAVPQLNLWTIWWNADRLLHGWSNYWTAPIFHPYRDAFALSEPQPITTLLAPLVWMFPASAVPYNIYFLISLALNGLLGELLLREIKVAWLPALFGGLMVAALPFIHWQRDAIQLIPIWGVLWFWLALASFATNPTWIRAALVGLSYSSVTLSCLHHALFLTMLSMFACWWLVSDRLGDPRFWLGMFIAVLVALVICGPFLLPQLQVLRGEKWDRNDELVESLSSWPRDYLWVWNSTWHGPPPIPAPQRGYWNMSPGWMALALALVALAAPAVRRVWRRYHVPYAEILNEGDVPTAPASQSDTVLIAESHLVTSGEKPRARIRWLGMLATVSVLALGLSLGAHLKWGHWNLHEFFVQFLPGYQQLRSPFRFGLFFQLSIFLLAAIGVECLWMLVFQCCRRSGANDCETAEAKLWAFGGWICAISIVMGLWMFEVGWHPVPLHAVPSTGHEDTTQPLWVDWLLANSEEDDVIAHLPFPGDINVYAYESTTDAMFWQMVHRRPMVNGYSGFFPPTFLDLKDACINFPSESNLEALKAAGVRFCVVQRGYYQETHTQPFEMNRLRWLYFDEPLGVDVYQLE